MNLAADLLRDYLATHKITQGEYAASCNASQSFVSQVLSGPIQISEGNLSKLLAGLKSKEDKLRFLVAYLHDQVPPEHVHDLAIRVADEKVRPFLIEEIVANSKNVFDAAIVEVLAQLPTQTKSQLYHFVQSLRVDPALRSVFHGIMRYVPAPTEAAPHTGRQGDSSGPFPIQIMKNAQALKQGTNTSSRAADTHARSSRAQKRSARATSKK